MLNKDAYVKLYKKKKKIETNKKKLIN